jgi:hypothetical protein
MAQITWEALLLVAGLFLIPFFFSEEFLHVWQRLQAVLQQHPHLRYFAYPLGALLILGAAALIIYALVALASSRFSYD